jgi:regulator of protease activity HflC (stomatin/prohibitin superfamily)
MVKGPGLRIIIPGIQTLVKMSLRTIAMDVPPQDVITRDNVSVSVNAVLYFRIMAADKALIAVENFLFATGTRRTPDLQGENQQDHRRDTRPPDRPLGHKGGARGA